MEKHQTVLLDEAINSLALSPSDTVVDATVGSGGHAKEILKILDTKGTLVAIDQDPSALQALSLEGDAAVHLVNRNFREIGEVCRELAIAPDAILADLGWRMEQFSESGKGFSFREDKPLQMTFGDPSNYPFVARDIVNEWSEESVANVLKGYGEERYARRIASAIVSSRPIETSGQLAKVIEGAVPGGYRHGKIHPATKSFQALRIAVNDELAALEEFIGGAFDSLAPTGRLAIISFHSIEDRIVKQAFRALKAEGKGTLTTKKPITASNEEVAENPRARSAKLRVIEKNEYDTNKDSSI